MLSRIISIAIAPCGPPKPRKAVLLCVFVFAQKPCMATWGSQ